MTDTERIALLALLENASSEAETLCILCSVIGFNGIGRDLIEEALEVIKDTLCVLRAEVLKAAVVKFDCGVSKSRDNRRRLAVVDGSGTKDRQAASVGVKG